MNLLFLYIGAIGVGMLGCLAATSTRVNRIASIAHYAGLLGMAVYAMFAFGFLHLLGVVFTILIVGAVLSYTVVKAKNK